MSKKNRWEYHACHRGPESLDECPAVFAMNKDGINQGKAARRSCWSIAGTDSIKDAHWKKVLPEPISITGSVGNAGGYFT